ncbi:hypothetical protein [Flavobacterium sp.]|uniref:hypothetical protein n=1 Tax=Flavobacterium sp. TaxID=239 RepID=UPI00261882D7|nr:hypothetical protein [Flavobacterium sp.]MDG2432761.1 hypothetical protein [Flavobacterium sp.]
MNEAHWHLVVNHFPVIGTIFGVGILIAGLVLKSNAIKNTAYVLFIVAAAFAFVSMYTGEGAEEMVEDMPNIGHHVIHEHEELAEKLAIALYALAFFSVVSLYTALKNHKFAKLVSYITLVLAIGAAVLGSFVGTSGGEIRHTEIRENILQTTTDSDFKKEEK